MVASRADARATHVVAFLIMNGKKLNRRRAQLKSDNLNVTPIAIRSRWLSQLVKFLFCFSKVLEIFLVYLKHTCSRMPSVEETQITYTAARQGGLKRDY